MASAHRRASPDPSELRLSEALRILSDLGLPRAQQNERSALTLLALLDLTPAKPWSAAEAPLLGVTPIMDFAAQHYKKRYAPNTRETFRRFTLHQFEHAGIVVSNPDQRDRPTNSPKWVYQVTAPVLALLRTFGTSRWEQQLHTYLANTETLTERYAQRRVMERIPLQLAPGVSITLSPGGQNELVQKIITEFCPRFTPRARPVYVGDTGQKWAYFDEALLATFGVTVDSHGKMPDVAVFYEAKGWLVLIEAVTSHGPVNPKRREELRALFAGSTVGLVFVTAFLTRPAMLKYLHEIAWETEVWIAEAPGHMIHFNGERFLGPY